MVPIKCCCQLSYSVSMRISEFQSVFSISLWLVCMLDCSVSLCLWLQSKIIRVEEQWQLNWGEMLMTSQSCLPSRCSHWSKSELVQRQLVIKQIKCKKLEYKLWFSPHVVFRHLRPWKRCTSNFRFTLSNYCCREYFHLNICLLLCDTDWFAILCTHVLNQLNAVVLCKNHHESHAVLS